jgi:hypothetical protein
MRRRASASLIAFALAASATGWAGCGSDDVDHAVDTAKEKGSNAADSAKDKAESALKDATGDDDAKKDDRGGGGGGRGY